jgi:hypothetical protein
MRPIRNIATIAAFATLCALPASGAELLIPQDKAVVTGDTLLVLGTGPNSRAIPWKIESGGKTRSGTARPVAGGFSINVPLKPGVSRLIVGNQTRDVFLSQGGAKAPRGFAGQRMHAADVSRCEDCHEANLQVREGGYPGVCLTCHVVEAQNPDYTGEAADDRHFASSVADSNPTLPYITYACAPPEPILRFQSGT